ncbi:MAG: thioredoxin [Clostridia bacterium]|nr:thioredoxin [Clostridia bacterium]
MLQIKSDKFQKEVIESKVPVLVDFSATWCGPCKMMGPVLEQLSAEYEGKAKVFKVDIDESMDLAQKYQIMSVPNMLFFKDGKPVDAVLGVTPPTVLKQKLDKIVE